MIRGREYLLQLFLFALLLVSCSSGIVDGKKENKFTSDTVKTELYKPTVYELETKVGAESIANYLPLIKGKRVAIVGNQTSVVHSTFLVDTLISLGVDIKILFAPEHGFRGDHDAGAKVEHAKDTKTGLSIFSLHGKTKKPSKESLDSIDVILFDIQDVGVRFYTYVSTLHYVLEAAAENNKKVIVLDRPNPNAHYIDGPVLDMKFKSFIGMHPVPVVYGMTIGEYGQMINGEFWLKDSVQADLTVIPVKNWTYNKQYYLPIAPSPNLPNQLSIYLYPSLCFFEGTEISIGRGTEFPFQVFGHPKFDAGDSLSFQFKPVKIIGKSEFPKHENMVCYGVDLRGISLDSLYQKGKLDFNLLLHALKHTTPQKKFFDRVSFSNLLAGNNTLIKDLKSKDLSAILSSWQEGINNFKIIREKYLIYN